MSDTRDAGVRVRYVDAAGHEHSQSLSEVDEGGLATALPIRRVVGRKGQRHRPGLFWSATTGDHVPYESWLELDRLWLADADPQVTWIAAQPMALDGWDGDVHRRHVPDLFLRRAGAAPLVVDVKPLEFATRPDVAAVFDWTAKAVRTQGWDFEVWTGAPDSAMADVRACAFARRIGHPSMPALQASHAGMVAELHEAWHGGGFALPANARRLPGKVLA